MSDYEGQWYEEVARLRSGRVVADHGDDGDKLEDFLVWKPDLWRR